MIKKIFNNFNFYCYNHKKAFTFIEILVYFLIFSFIIVIIFNALSNFFNYYVDFYSKNSFSTELKNIFFKLNNLSFYSKKLNILTDWEIVFDYRSTTDIVFMGQSAYLNNKDNYIHGYFSNLSIGSIKLKDDSFGVYVVNSSTCYINSTVSIPSKYALQGYAWSPNIGWIKFRNSGGEEIFGVCLDLNNELRGYAWNDVIGWISFNCQDYNNDCNVSNYRMKLSSDNSYLDGYAWNDIIGWLFVFKNEGQLYLAKSNPEIYSLELISNPSMIFRKFNWRFISSTLNGYLEVGNRDSDFFDYYDVTLSNYFK